MIDYASRERKYFKPNPQGSCTFHLAISTLLVPCMIAALFMGVMLAENIGLGPLLEGRVAPVLRVTILACFLGGQVLCILLAWRSLRFYDRHVPFAVVLIILHILLLIFIIGAVLVDFPL